MYDVKGAPYEDIFFGVEDSEGNTVNGLVNDDALAYLLLAGELFVVDGATEEDSRVQVVSIYLNCNDLFYRAADMEPLPYNEIGNLYKSCFDKEGNPKKWGGTIWACLQRKMRPLYPIEKLMKKQGFWTDELEALPVRKDTG